MPKYFYKETGMYIDWKQLAKLPDIDTLVDIGVGPNGTPDLYERFPNQKLILIDPLDEAEIFYKDELKERDALFYKTALGAQSTTEIIKVEREIGRSTLLDVTDINFEGVPVDRRVVPVCPLDNVLDRMTLGKIGIKIDTEGYELNIIRGASKTLKQTTFVLAEVRHNHDSFTNMYQLRDFMLEMQNNGFVLTMIMTAKPFIADLCFERICKAPSMS